MRFDRLRREESPPTFPLTALVDVLFLMITFLVLGARFDTVDTVRLPESGAGVPAQQEAGVTVVLRENGDLWLGDAPLAPEQAVSRLRALHPGTVLLLPDERADVGALFRWHDRLRQGLDVPVQVGVRRREP